ncbi:MAG TPA: hypothetical protein EYQ80_01580 [Candidatus Poseidoniales archaeon]|nr:hypothetical protein [Candidatus Poseidoniales archaeon]
MSMDTIIAKWFSTRDQKMTWAISIAFLLVFPLYFANMASFLPDDARVSSDSSGKWTVSFEESVELEGSFSEMVDDGHIEEFDFSYVDTSTNLAYLEITVSHDETNENALAGPTIGAQCDEVSVTVNMAGVEGYIESDSTTDSTSSSCPSEQILRIYLIHNYTTEAHEMDGKKSEIIAHHSDNGTGRGDWAFEFELSVNRGGPPGPGPNNQDNGEQVNVEWQLVSVEVSVVPVINTEV